MAALLDHPRVTERYFFPRREVPGETIRVEVDGASLACAAHRPHGGDAPVLLFFHGNGEVVADYVPEYAHAFASIGFDSFFAEYRGYGGSTGTPGLVRMLDDVAPILDSVGVPDERLVVYGRSVGSIYAIHAAHLRPRIRGLVIESGISNPLARVLLRVTPGELGVTLDELRDEAARYLDHEKKLRGFPGPVLVMHCEHDDLVLPAEARANASWSRRSELLLFPHGDHNSIHAHNLPAILAALARR